MAEQTSWKSIETARKTRIAHWLRNVGSRASVAQAELWLGKQPAYRAIAEQWDDMGPGEREAALGQLTALFRAAAYATRPFCIRCGACCSNAGPTLYPGDEPLLHVDGLTHALLRTLRVGEEVFSHRRNRRAVLEREVVMIAPALPGNCPLFDVTARQCTVHEHRPAQCKAQKCWDTRDSDKLAGWPGLTRRDLLEEDDPLCALISEHDSACSVSSLRDLAAGVRQGDDQAGPALVKMVRRDREIRQRILHEELAPEDALPFLLGRPVEMLLGPMGLELTRGWKEGMQVRRA